MVSTKHRRWKITFRWWWFRQWMLTQKWRRWFCFILPNLPKNCHTTAYNYTLAPQEGLFKKRFLLFLLGWHLSEVYVRYLQMFCVFQGTEATHLQSRDWPRRAALLMLSFVFAGVKSFSPKHGLPFSAIQNVECMIQEKYALRCCFTINSHPGGFCTFFSTSGWCVGIRLSIRPSQWRYHALGYLLFFTLLISSQRNDQRISWHISCTIILGELYPKGSQGREKSSRMSNNDHERLA